jgi:hypothetical protein
MLGKKITTLVDDVKPGGYYNLHWDAKDDIGRDLSSGVYFYVLQTDNYKKSQRMLVVK